MQKYAPNSGYVQFLFSDMCPQSFYGIYDWWGLPKAGLTAMLESNMPLGVFLKYNGDHTDAVYVVNDNLEAMGEVQVKCVFTNREGCVIASEEKTVDLGADSIVRAWNIELKAAEHECVNCALILSREGRVIATNHYEDLFHMPEHVKGHPSRISHELGMRLYFA